MRQICRMNEKGGWVEFSAQTKQMKRRLMVLISAIFALVLLLGVTSAFAADDPLRVAMQLSTSSFAEPQEITVVIQVTNSSDTDMPGAVTLYDPDGNQIEAFGSPALAAGASKVWEGTWNVTQEQLEAGKITFRLRYPVYNDDGELVNKTRSFSKAITYEGAVTIVEINRRISPTVAETGKAVTVTYEVVNAGTVSISDVEITEHESISKQSGKIASVAAGEKATYVFTTTMDKSDLTSEGTITYRANGATETVTKEAETIRYGEMNLAATLEADRKGAAAGEAIALTLTLRNSGTTDYTNISVTDPSLGVVFSGLTVAAGQTETYKSNIVMNDVTSYQYTVSATDGNGLQVETATDAVSLIVLTADDVINLSVTASADRETIYQIPGVVKFQVAVTNNSASEVTRVRVSASGVTLYTFPSILPGETREFTRDVNVSMQGQYQFVASTTNALEETQTFSSNIIQIAFAEPTAVPTEAPIVTPPVPELLEIPTVAEGYEGVQQTKQVVFNVYRVAFVIMVIGIAVVALAILTRLIRKVNAPKVVDTIEIPATRDYEKSSVPMETEETASAPTDSEEVAQEQNEPDKQEEN